MNITVINAKDIFKYIIKTIALIILIYICGKIFKNSDIIRQNKIEEEIKKNSSKIKEYSFTECLDISISLMSYKKQETKVKNVLSSDKILAMGASILDKTIIENTDLIVNEKELTKDDVEELSNQIPELLDKVITENVKENNIEPKYNNTYESVKINNQSDYKLTEDILKPNIKITNKKDVLIYHTHTCESYTPSKRI